MEEVKRERERSGGVMIFFTFSVSLSFITFPSSICPSFFPISFHPSLHNLLSIHPFFLPFSFGHLHSLSLCQREYKQW